MPPPDSCEAAPGRFEGYVSFTAPPRKTSGRAHAGVSSSKRRLQAFHWVLAMKSSLNDALIRAG
jgi:hypothetical protein